mmetsp:Transcript_73576/g.172343  ORF Transcript_73576/g.172343 Transcript_73576/m.172343 type:complete len:250 (+) Transcript_73576:247-996(+)
MSWRGFSEGASKAAGSSMSWSCENVCASRRLFCCKRCSAAARMLAMRRGGSGAAPSDNPALRPKPALAAPSSCPSTTSASAVAMVSEIIFCNRANSMSSRFPSSAGGRNGLVGPVSMGTSFCVGSVKKFGSGPRSSPLTRSSTAAGVGLVGIAAGRSFSRSRRCSIAMRGFHFRRYMCSPRRSLPLPTSCPWGEEPGVERWSQGPVGGAGKGSGATGCRTGGKRREGSVSGSLTLAAGRMGTGSAGAVG